jgi:ADP-glucose pyrophosphorylase
MTQISQLGCMCEYVSSHSKIVRPFQEWNEDCQITNKQMDYTWGDDKFFDKINLIRNIDKDYFTIPSGPRVYRYFIFSDKIKRYQVGARDMLEYISHKIENKHLETNAYDFPYRTVDKLFEYY